MGWKEDLNLSFESPVPSQKQAARYLARAAKAVSGLITVCGHSKGGNLAVYAGACVPEKVQERIESVISFDGPGQDERVIDSPGYARIRQRLRLYIPHFSVVGMLLEQEKRYTVVESDEKGIMQHSAFSWQVEGRRFMEKPELSAESLEVNRILRKWLKGLSPEDRRVFSDAVYEVLASGGGKDARGHGRALAKERAGGAQSAAGPFRATSGRSSRRRWAIWFSIAVSGIRLPWAKEKKAEDESRLP